MKIDDIANLVGQEIISESKNGCVDVKYKHSCCSTYMRKNEYYLQLITGCDNYGKWFDMKYFTSIWLFFGSKGLIFWATPLVGFITKFYIQDKTIKAIVCAILALIWIFFVSEPIYDRIGSALNKIQMPTIMYLSILFFTQASVIMSMKAGEITAIRHICQTVCKFSTGLFFVGLAQAIIWTIGSIVLDIVNSFWSKKVSAPYTHKKK